MKAIARTQIINPYYGMLKKKPEVGQRHGVLGLRKPALWAMLGLRKPAPWAVLELRKPAPWAVLGLRKPAPWAMGRKDMERPGVTSRETIGRGCAMARSGQSR